MPDLKHTFQSAKSDGGDATLVRPSNWNEAHDLSTRKWLMNNLQLEDYPASPTAYDDEFDDTTGNSGTNNGLDARWTWRNQNSATVTFGSAGWLSLNDTSHSGDNWKIIEQTIPAGDWTIEAKIAMNAIQGSTRGCGIVLVDSSGGGLYSFGPYQEGGAHCVELIRWNSVTSWNSTPARSDNIWNATAVFRIAKSSTTYSCYVGDGISMFRMFSSTLAITPTRFGLGVNDSNSGSLTLLADYFRKTA